MSSNSCKSLALTNCLIGNMSYMARKTPSLSIYGDPAYPLRVHLQTLYLKRRGNLTPEQAQFIVIIQHECHQLMLLFFLLLLLCFPEGSKSELHFLLFSLGLSSSSLHFLLPHSFQCSVSNILGFSLFSAACGFCCIVFFVGFSFTFIISSHQIFLKQDTRKTVRSSLFSGFFQRFKHPLKSLIRAFDTAIQLVIQNTEMKNEYMEK